MALPGSIWRPGVLQLHQPAWRPSSHNHAVASTVEAFEIRQGTLPLVVTPGFLRIFSRPHSAKGPGWAKTSGSVVLKPLAAFAR
jgi:hypothetical protein